MAPAAVRAHGEGAPAARPRRQGEGPVRAQVSGVSASCCRGDGSRDPRARLGGRAAAQGAAPRGRGGDGHPRAREEQASEKNPIGGDPLALFPAVALAVGCASLRGAQTCDDAFARDVAALLDEASDATSFPGSEQFKADVLALLETLSRCASCLLAAPSAVASRLLPSLAKCLERRDEPVLENDDASRATGDAPDAADRRSLALKLVCDVLLPLLLEPPPPRRRRRQGRRRTSETTSRRRGGSNVQRATKSLCSAC